MKNVVLEVFTGNTQIKKTIQVNSNLGFSKLLGTSINSIFEFNERLRKYNASHIKANDVVSVVISVNDKPVIDSYELNSEYGFKLKFGQSAKSKKRFAKCLYDLTEWATQDVKVIAIDELLKSFEE